MALPRALGSALNSAAPRVRWLALALDKESHIRALLIRFPFLTETRSPLGANTGRFVLIPNGQKYNHQKLADSRFLCRGRPSKVVLLATRASESATSVVGFLNLLFDVSIP